MRAFARVGRFSHLCRPPPIKTLKLKGIVSHNEGELNANYPKMSRFTHKFREKIAMNLLRFTHKFREKITINL